MLKLTDFGLSEFFSLQNQKPFSDIAGSAFYVAPEVLRRKYGPAADLWSSGVIMYILLTGEVRSSRWRHHARMHSAARSRAVEGVLTCSRPAAQRHAAYAQHMSAIRHVLH